MTHEGANYHLEYPSVGEKGLMSSLRLSHFSRNGSRSWPEACQDDFQGGRNISLTLSNRGLLFLQLASWNMQLIVISENGELLTANLL